MAEKTYLKCSAKEKTFSNGGSLIRIGVKASDLIEFAKAHANERGYINLNVQARREVGTHGDTHSVTLDTYQPSAVGRQVTDDGMPNW